jgi:hypothetical protein
MQMKMTITQLCECWQPKALPLIARVMLLGCRARWSLRTAPPQVIVLGITVWSILQCFFRPAIFHVMVIAVFSCNDRPHEGVSPAAARPFSVEET